VLYPFHDSVRSTLRVVYLSPAVFPYPTRSTPVELATVLLPTVTVYRPHRMDRRYPHVQHRCRVLKVERPRHRQLDLFVFVFVIILTRASPSRRMGIAALFVVTLGHGMLRLTQLERRRLPLFSILIPCLSASAVVASATLSFSIASENDIGDDGGSGVVIVGLVNPVATNPAGPRRGTRSSE